MYGVVTKIPELTKKLLFLRKKLVNKVKMTNNAYGKFNKTVLTSDCVKKMSTDTFEIVKNDPNFFLETSPNARLNQVIGLCTEGQTFVQHCCSDSTRTNKNNPNCRTSTVFALSWTM